MDGVWVVHTVLLVALVTKEQIEDPHAEEVRQRLSEWRGEGSEGE